jgi:hypothetical protein
MLKGNSRKKGDFRGLIDTAEADLGDFRIEFLGEFDAICKKAELLDAYFQAGKIKINEESSER